MAVIRFSVALSPAAVGAATVAEQTFTAGPGDLPLNGAVSVTKPAVGNAVGIVNARVASATQIAIAFVNPTAGALTPTAGEVYQVSVTT